MNEREPAEASAAPRRFTAEELVACEKCARANAPTRMNCLYFGARLPVTEQNAALRRPVLKKLEEWESGFNVVIGPRARAELSPEEIAEAASLLRLDASRLTEMIESRRALPLARTSSTEEVELISKRLGALGLAVEVFTDEVLSKQPARVRALALDDDDALVCHAGPDAEPRRLRWSGIALLVTGRIVTKRVEVAERQAKLSSRSRIVEARELATDEAVLDIYATDDREDGFRVMADSFDYSCLGASKRLLARDNFNALVESLRARAPHAAFDDEYARLRGLLSAAWPPSEHTGSLGLRRERAGRYNTEAVTTVSNEAQFTRYARLRWTLALRGRAKDS
jgi:hypothetical protein